jgi:hypothetical protein
VPTSPAVRSVRSAATVVLAAAGALLVAAVTVAGPAAALEDPRRPGAEVTHGPSCGPGVVRVAVTNGTAAHRVALVFDGTDVQQSAVLAGGEQVELVSVDVDWGQTVDVSVTVVGADGAAELPIEFGTYTRPSAEDCAAVALPGDGEPVPTPGALPRATGTDAARNTASSASSSSVAPGGVVTVRGTGFTPGEPVAVSMAGVAERLTTVHAATDGSVEAVVQIPRAAALGTATVQLVGGVSDASAGLDLLVAARAPAAPEESGSGPVSAAGTAVLGAAGALGLVVARRSRPPATPAPR